jgi:hypothetical protein
MRTNIDLIGERYLFKIGNQNEACPGAHLLASLSELGREELAILPAEKESLANSHQGFLSSWDPRILERRLLAERPC